jgi:glycosyltransferase involved in cell wall biosynthesis
LTELGTETPVAVAGNGVAVDEWPEGVLAASRAPVAAFFGSFRHHPNRHGLEWFTSLAWPLVRSAVPDASLLLLGSGDPPPASLAQPGVRHVGWVDDLARCLSRVRVVIAPIVDGMGSRVKFGEALASGAAVVSTSQGAEGFDAEGRFLRADEPEAFADATVQLLRDRARAAALGRAGRMLALERYSWERTSEPIAAWIDEVTT